PLHRPSRERSGKLAVGTADRINRRRRVLPAIADQPIQCPRDSLRSSKEVIAQTFAIPGQRYKADSRVFFIQERAPCSPRGNKTFTRRWPLCQDGKLFLAAIHLCLAANF